jgi:hypothetical protein
MKTKKAVRRAIFALMAVLSAAAPLMAQGPSCFVTPGMEKTRVSVRELDQDGNPLGELGSGWLNLGERVPVTSRTGSIVIKYQQASADKGYQTDPRDCSNGNVITVP